MPLNYTQYFCDYTHVSNVLQTYTRILLLTVKIVTYKCLNHIQRKYNYVIVTFSIKNTFSQGVFYRKGVTIIANSVELQQTSRIQTHLTHVSTGTVITLI